MQINPHKYSQTFLTVVGLSLLVLAMVLNHYHPRNQGIADITHGSFYKISRQLIGLPEVVPSSNKLLATIQSTLRTSKPEDSQPVPKIDDTNQPPPATAIGDTPPASQDCGPQDKKSDGSQPASSGAAETCQAQSNSRSPKAGD